MEERTAELEKSVKKLECEITELKRAEEELLSYQNRLEAVKHIGALANASLDLEKVLRSILKGTIEASVASVGMIFLRDTNTGCLEWGASIGLSEAFVEEYRSRLIQPDEGLTGRIAETGEPIYIPRDSSHDPRIARPVVEAEELNSFLGVPIHAEGGIIGVMNILTRPPDVLSEKEIALVAAVGTHVGSAIRNARLFKERKRAEEEVAALKALNENVVQSMQDGLVALDRDFRVTLWNKGMEEISGYAAEEVLGQVVLDVFPHLTEQGVNEMFKTALGGEAAERLNVPYKTPKGKEGYTNERFAPLRDHMGEVIGVLAVVEDVTELLQLEQHVASLQEEIRERRLIDIAKGILMRERGMTISESHNFILKKGRDERIKAEEIARQLIVLLGTPEERKKFL